MGNGVANPKVSILSSESLFSVGLEPAAEALLGKLLEMHIPRPSARPTESETRGWGGGGGS